MTVPVTSGRFAAVLCLVLLAACAKPADVAPPAPAAPPVEPAQPSPPAPAPAGVTDAAIIATAQRLLVLLGYDAGKADGIAGAATRRAVRAFQKDRELAQDGLVTLALMEKLKAAQAQRNAAILLSAGDTLIYSDGSVETVAAERVVQWDQPFGKSALVAARPATAGWPPAARAGLDWAISHALDRSGNAPTPWSSTGVEERFEIRTFALTRREAALAGKRPCRRFEVRAGMQRRYPGIACRERNGSWRIARSKVTLARPATALGHVGAAPDKPLHN